LLDLANAYLRMWAKLSYVDLWYTVPQAADSERAASQLWHLDFDDKHLLKAFLYLNDVDEDSGPFEYVPGSQPAGRYDSVWHWSPLRTGRIPDEQVRATVPADGVKTFTAPRGTLILCNTSGLHRGGFSTAKPRVLATATYCSPASLHALSRRNFTPASDTLGTMSAAARFAVS
jgi:Phytanoyl-CoA dioxygenase (PhyH)